MILRLEPSIPLDTPNGPSLAIFLIEAGDEHDLQWVCAVQSGERMNEIWTWRNQDVRMRTKVTTERQDTECKTVLGPQHPAIPFVAMLGRHPPEKVYAVIAEYCLAEHRAFQEPAACSKGD